MTKKINLLYGINFGESWILHMFNINESFMDELLHKLHEENSLNLIEMAGLANYKRFHGFFLTRFLCLDFTVISLHSFEVNINQN